MGRRKFGVGDRVKVRRYPHIPKKVHIRYGGKIGRITGTRYIDGRLWYKVSFSRFDTEEFTANELVLAW